MRPLGLGETLDAAMKLVQARFGTFLAAALPILVPLQVVSILLVLATTPAGVSGAQQLIGDIENLKPQDEGVFFGGMAGSLLVEALASTVAMAACIWIAAEVRADRQVAAPGALRALGSRLGSVLWLLLLTAVLLALSVLTIVGVFWLAVSWAFVMPILLVEGLRGRRALGRSFRLVEGRWWATAARLLVAVLIVAIGSGIIEAVLTLPGYAFGDETSDGFIVAAGVARAGATALTMPFFAAFLLIAYQDLRARRDAGIAAGAQTQAPVSAETFGGFAPPSPPRPT